ncbi:MAG: aromatic ring-hydroxylating dioxygenase subunit alpha [Halioglobus sp.]
MSRELLVTMAKDKLEHAIAGTIRQADTVAKIPAQNYYNQSRWDQEMTKVFNRLPLLLAVSSELSEPGAYKAITAGTTPVLLCRTQSGELKAYINACAHRGAQIMPAGCGTVKRFTCPYHAWGYNFEGELTHVYSPDDFGEIDKSANGLVELSALEKNGLIWVLLNPDSRLNIEEFLCGYDEPLGSFNFESWYLFDSRRIDGPNWKIAYDGYLDFYHLPILHRDTFGGDTSNKALYYEWGPHQHVASPQTTQDNLGEQSEADWPTDFLLSGVWTIFPHVSIASFGEGTDARGVLVSQLFPGETPGESYTIQNYLMEKEPTGEQREIAAEQFKLLKYVVEEEDYKTGLLQQQSLKTGALKHVMFGRNEVGGQNFHRWLQRVLDASDEDLPALFSA